MALEQFPKANRLLTRLDYGRVFSQSKRIQNQFFTLLIHYSDQIAAARLGMVVSKKVDKTAVQRNRIKRLIRETFRKNNQLKPADYVVMAKRPSARAENRVLIHGLEQLWSQTEKK